MLLNKSLHSSSIPKEFIDKEEIINNIFSSCVEPLLKYINHPALLHEWKVNIDAVAYKKKLMLTSINLLIKKKYNHHDSDLYWSTSIKDTIQWFPFLTIMEYTENIIKPNKGLITSLLSFFSVFQLCLFYDKDKV